MGKRPSHAVASIARDAQRSLRVCSQALGPPRCCQGGGLPVSYWESVSCAFTCPRGYATELREDYSKVDSRHSQHEIVPSSHPVPLEFRRWRWSAYGFRRQRWCPLIEFRDKRPDDLQRGGLFGVQGQTDTSFPSLPISREPVHSRRTSDCGLSSPCNPRCAFAVQDNARWKVFLAVLSAAPRVAAVG